MSDPLHRSPAWLSSKLGAPFLPPSLVQRRRLLVMLDRALTTPLTLVTGPAGYGKSTAVSDWVASLRTSRPDVTVAWLTLDASDNEPVRFVSHLMAAAQALAGVSAAVSTFAGSNAQSDLYGVVLSALQLLQPAPHAVLVLDDVHLVDNPLVDDLLLFILEHAPPSVHLVLVSRVDPPLPLARLRARGQLTEIRQRDLRMNVAETADLIQRVSGVQLEAPTVGALHDRTEGWAAGLHLLALALPAEAEERAAFYTSVAETHRHILDYLHDEVLLRQPDDIRAFLLDTAILSRLSAALCDAVRGRDDSQTFLERLDRANLFVIPLDVHRSWYRYHHLFADLLRRRLAQERPQALPGLHRRASEWYAAQARESGEPQAADEAVDHAASTGDPALLAERIALFADAAWERGEQDKLREWLGRLSDSALAAYPRLCVLRGWLGFIAGHYDEADRSLDLAEQNASAVDDETAGRIAATRAFVATFRGQVAPAVEHAQAALARLPDGSTWRGSAAIALGDARGLQGRLSDAEPAYLEALQISHRQGNLYLSLNAAYKLASMQRQRGLLHQAYDTCLREIARVDGTALAQTTLVGCLHALAGDILCEWNRLPEALDRTALAVATGARGRHLGFIGWIYLFRLRVLLAARDFAAFDATADDFDELVRTAQVPPWIASPVAALLGLRLLAVGDTVAATAWARSRGLGVDTPAALPRAYELVALIQLWAALGQTAQAARLAEDLLDQLRPTEQVYGKLLFMTLLAVLHSDEGRADDAQALVVEALRLAEPGGFIRQFVEAGPGMRSLLARARSAAPDYVAQVLAAFPVGQAAKAHADNLSERELEVLRLLADGLTNQAIADRLVISLNTVLYHTKNIYAKLDVERRTQAVNRARELGLL